jgi:replication factor C subunit 2/4
MQGYAAIDVVSTLFRVCKTGEMDPALKLAFAKEIGFAHLRIANGLDTSLQLSGLVAKLCLLATGNPV